jgi:protein TonB
MHITIKDSILCMMWCVIASAVFAEQQKTALAESEIAPALEQSKSPSGKAIPLITILGSAEGPKFEKQVSPDYPFAAKQQGIEGTVMLHLSIDEFGMLQNVEVLEATDRIFISAAITSVKKSFFLPAKNNRQPVPSQAILPVHFKLKK